MKKDIKASYRGHVVRVAFLFQSSLLQAFLVLDTARYSEQVCTLEKRIVMQSFSHEYSYRISPNKYLRGAFNEGGIIN